jgi:hypothetical protein
MLPENDLLVPTSLKSNIDQNQFNQTIDAIVTEFKIDLISHGVLEIKVNKDWDNDKVNASARKKDGVFELNVYGGLARHNLINTDALTLVVCHEIGHIVGGAPTWKPFSIASSEGQADYFATLKCFRRLYKNNKIRFLKKDVHKLAWKKCRAQYSQEVEFHLCLRSSKAQERLASLLKVLTNEPKTPDFSTPDPYKIMFILFNGYPNLQCRLDTLFAGSLCINDPEELLDMQLYNKAVCSKFSHHTTGIRPQCWYVPTLDD